MKNTCFTTDPVYYGCYKDTATRGLPIGGTSTNLITCHNNALAGGYKYFGLQAGNASTGVGQCWMGNDLALAKSYGASTGCTQITGAKAGNTMGGAWTNALYSTANANPNYMGCYKDDVGVRALPNRLPNGTLQECANRSKANGDNYFGLQYGSATTGIGECWSGKDLALAQKYGATTGCTQIVGAKAGNTMGGANTNALYSFW
jgi:hypothetical protein